MNRWIIPDLHGCAKTLKALIEEKIQPQKTDTIIFLGDYIDRGPDSRGTIDYIISLQNEGFNIRTLKGNHEDYLLLAHKEVKNGNGSLIKRNKQQRLNQEWLQHGGNDTLRSFNIKKIKNIPEKYLDWLNQLEYYILEEEYVIVHAGLNFSRRDPFEDKHSMLWSRSFQVDKAKIGNRKVIHGHVPVSLDFIKTCIADPDKHYIPLDNGCCMPDREGMGNLVAFEMNSKKLVVQPNIEV